MTMRAPSLSAVTTRVSASGKPEAWSMTLATFSGERRVRQTMVEPEPLRKPPERAGIFRGSDHSIEKGNEFRSERLVKMIGQSPAQILVVAARQGGGDEASVAAGLNRAQAIDFVRQDPARFRRLDFKSGNQKDKAQVRLDRKLWCRLWRATTKPPNSAGAALSGWPSSSAQSLEDLGALERAIEQGIERVEHAQPHRDTAAEPARARHLALDHAGKCKGLAAGRAEESAGGLLRHCTRLRAGSCARP